eukprot:1682163-Amphidinium_carterae.1
MVFICGGLKAGADNSPCLNTFTLSTKPPNEGLNTFGGPACVTGPDLATTGHHAKKQNVLKHHMAADFVRCGNPWLEPVE